MYSVFLDRLGNTEKDFSKYIRCYCWDSNRLPSRHERQLLEPTCSLRHCTDRWKGTKVWKEVITPTYSFSSWGWIQQVPRKPLHSSSKAQWLQVSNHLTPCKEITAAYSENGTKQKNRSCGHNEMWIRKTNYMSLFVSFISLTNSCSTCFGQPCAHHQELTTAWCYSLVLVCAVAAGSLSSPVGR